MTIYERKRGRLIAVACGVAFALTHGSARQIVLGAILLSALLAIAMAGWRLWRLNGSLRGTIEQLETGIPQRNPVDGGLLPAFSDQVLALKWAGMFIASAALWAIDPNTKILAAILMAIVAGLLVDGILCLRVRSTGRRLKGYAAVLSQVADKVTPAG